MAPELFDSKTKITEKIDALALACPQPSSMCSRCSTKVWAMGCIFVEVPLRISRKLALRSLRESSFTNHLPLSSVQAGQQATPGLNWYENQ